MTRKEKEKILLDGLGLKVGDEIILTNFSNKYPFKIKEMCDIFCLYREHDDFVLKIDYLVTEEFKKYIEPKKWKDMFCSSISDCNLCPLGHIESCGYGDTLQERLNTAALDDDEREFYQKRINRKYKEEE